MKVKIKRFLIQINNNIKVIVYTTVFNAFIMLIYNSKGKEVWILYFLSIFEFLAVMIFQMIYQVKQKKG